MNRVIGSLDASAVDGAVTALMAAGFDGDQLEVVTANDVAGPDKRDKVNRAPG